VALVAPASGIDDERIELACTNVRALGLNPVLAEHARARNTYLAGTDRERADDFNAALNDDSIRAIFALRGGYGTMRIAPAIDYDAFARTPKAVMGYSDMTVLLNALSQRAGAITFHGPVLAAPMSDVAREWIVRALFDETPLGELRAATTTVHGGTASGRLCGGNLSLLAHTCGTPYAVDFSDALVMIEDVHEADYRMDRLLTQLVLSGALERARGFLIGDVPNVDIVAERLLPLQKPIVAGWPIGHIEDQWVMPIGAHAWLEGDVLTLRS
jgi:muramoyltetrapeptide carboxypeptidase